MDETHPYPHEHPHEPPQAGGSPDEAPRATDEQVAARRRRWTRIGVMGFVFAVGAAMILPEVPREQRVRLHLGAGSSQVVKATARVAQVKGRSGATWDRETTWQFPSGAPPSLAWTFELPNGAADVEVELVTKADAVAKTTRVELGGEDANVELVEAMRALQ